MKLLTQTLDHNDAQRLKSRIERAGIPVVVGGAEARHVFRSGMVSVWVAIDSQFDDAVIALSKPNHMAANPVDVEAFHLAVRQTSLFPAWNYPALLTYAGVIGFTGFLIWAVLSA